ncbi:MAG: hypothetical protein HYV41_03320 [Candidatus Magasanikbacteria bacterium]|nr:hypothetical protein [Candidatus Magasanikbacteria bacterium]
MFHPLSCKFKLYIGLIVSIVFFGCVNGVVYAQDPKPLPQYVSSSPSSSLSAQINKQTKALVGKEGAQIQSSADIRIIIARTIKVFLGFVGTLATVYTVYGGYLYLTSAGSEDRMSHGRRIILYGVLGILIILSSYSIAWFVYKIYYRASEDPFTTPGYSFPFDHGKYEYDLDTDQMYQSDPFGPPDNGKKDINIMGDVVDPLVF